MNSADVSTWNNIRERRQELSALLSEADPWLVLVGDWGGQIYLTVPCSLLGDAPQIDTLLDKLDRFAWACNEGDGASVGLYHFDVYNTEMEEVAAGLGIPMPEEIRLTAEHGVDGGMGGGTLEGGLWLHEEFSEAHWSRAKVLLGLEG